MKTVDFIVDFTHVDVDLVISIFCHVYGRDLFYHDRDRADSGRLCCNKMEMS